jgi:hypothetical protein
MTREEMLTGAQAYIAYLTASYEGWDDVKNSILSESSPEDLMAMVAAAAALFKSALNHMEVNPQEFLRSYGAIIL